jgi:hypothetical protein
MTCIRVAAVDPYSLPIRAGGAGAKADPSRIFTWPRAL